jgi:5-methylcytosine-specific restriction enzyme A
MNDRPLRPCLHPQCYTLIREGGDGARGGRCSEHAQGHDRARRKFEKGREWYYTQQWVTLRRACLRRWPTCVMCLRKDRVSASTVADHVTPHRGRWDWFSDQGNLAGLCAKCHSGPKAAMERPGREHELAEYVRYVDTLRSQWRAAAVHPAQTPTESENVEW